MLISCKACAAVNVIDSQRATGAMRCVICRKPISITSADDDSRQSFRARPMDEGKIDRSKPPPLPQLEATREARVLDILDEEDEDLASDPPSVSKERVPEGLAETVPSIPVAKRNAGERQNGRRIPEKWMMAAFLVAIGVGTAGAALASANGNHDHETAVVPARAAKSAVRIASIPAPAGDRATPAGATIPE